MQGHPNKIYANMGHVTDTTGPVKRREQIKRPFRILVYKSPIVAHYPLKFIKVLHTECTVCMCILNLIPTDHQQSAKGVEQECEEQATGRKFL